MTEWTPGTWPDEGPWPSYGSEGWLLDEDRALRDLMKGMIVSDHEKGERHVEAWFGHPDQELREQKYPYVTVDLLQIEEGKDRVHRGHWWVLEPPAPWYNWPPLTGNQIIYHTEMPTPVDLFYQVSTWARNPRHDRQILFQMITGGRARLRGNRIWIGDKTDRRLDYLGHVKRDTVEGGKRLFNNVFRLRMSSQVPWNVIEPLAKVNTYGPVDRIYLDFYSYAAAYTEAQTHEAEVITHGSVTHWDQMERTATVKLHAVQTEITDVPAVRGILDPVEGSTVVVLQRALVSQPTQPSDFRFVILEVAAPPVAVPSQENGVSA